MTETIFTNARVVLDDQVVAGSVVVRDGLVAEVSSTPSSHGEDLAGDYLLPGLVELHTDHLEGHYLPRPGIAWDPVPAVLAFDAQLASAGATTVFDAVRIGSSHRGDLDGAPAAAHRLTDAMEHAQGQGLLRAEHFLHLRCEVAAEDCVTAFESFGDDPHVRLASLMDHTPGQRQYANLEAFRTYVVGKGSVKDSELEDHMAALKVRAEQFSDAHRHRIAELARERGIILAAHDDATAEHVDEAVALGVTISEFPTTVLAARLSRQQGLHVVMGAPNIVRGGSQSGNVAATDLLDEGLLDILSSDYVPASPLQAVFLLAFRRGLALPDAVRLVSRGPAEAVGLHDRGSIEPGHRADLVRVHAYELEPSVQHPVGLPVPVVRAVWRGGQRVV